MSVYSSFFDLNLYYRLTTCLHSIHSISPRTIDHELGSDDQTHINQRGRVVVVHSALVIQMSKRNGFFLIHPKVRVGGFVCGVAQEARVRREFAGKENDIIVNKVKERDRVPFVIAGYNTTRGVVL